MDSWRVVKWNFLPLDEIVSGAAFSLFSWWADKLSAGSQHIALRCTRLLRIGPIISYACPLFGLLEQQFYPFFPPLRGWIYREIKICAMLPCVRTTFFLCVRFDVLLKFSVFLNLNLQFPLCECAFVCTILYSRFSYENS